MRRGKLSPRLRGRAAVPARPPLPGRRASRLMAAALLFSLAPMLTFMGHWPRVVIPLPGDAYLAVPFTGSPGHDGHHHSHGSPEGDAAEHERHCHAAAATCSNFQTSASAPVAVVRDTLAFLGASALFLPAAVAGEGVYLPPALAIDEPPPRTALA